MQFLGASVDHEVMTEKAYKLLPLLNIRPHNSPAYPRPCVHESLRSVKFRGASRGRAYSYLPAAMVTLEAGGHGCVRAVYQLVSELIQNPELSVAGHTQTRKVQGLPVIPFLQNRAVQPAVVAPH